MEPARVEPSPRQAFPRPASQPSRHTLTLDFGRLLSDREWARVVVKARQLPYVKHLRVDEL